MKNRIAITILAAWLFSILAVSALAGQLVIDRDMVNIRQQPTTESAIVFRLSKGVIITELQKQERWYEIELDGATKRSGWVFDTLVKGFEEQAKEETLILATMGDVSLGADEMQKMLALLDPETQENLRKQPDVLQRVISEEIVRKVVLKAALARGFDKEEFVARLMERAKSQALADHFLQQQASVSLDFPGEEEVAAAYNKNIAEFTTPAQFHVGQIFIAVPRDSTKDAALKLASKAKEVAELAGEQSEDFAALARELSEHRPTAEKGGDIGWVEKNALLPEMRDVLTEMEVGQVSAPIRSNQGWHLFKLIDKKDEAIRPLPAVAGNIRETLRREKMEQNRRDYIKDLLERKPIAIDEKVFTVQFGEKPATM